MCESSRFELAIDDERYPAQLAQMSGAPEVLYGIGDPCALRPGLAVVGARKATPYGLHCAHMLTRWAARAGYLVVSGGAVGCDQAAHVAALEAGGTTVAVMGCGADVAYPRGARRLLQRIAAHGAVVSEFPWGTQPQRWTFRRRNRVIAGLSAAVLILEAGVGSGTFSTAEYALDAGRDVLAVPGSILAPECRGTNRLIRQGATPITEPDDLRLALEPLLGAAAVVPPPWVDPDDHGDDPLLSAVRTNPARPDDLARALGLDIVTTVRRLGVLEATGSVARYADGRFGAAR